MDVKISLLLLALTLGVLILAFMLISNALGNIYNVLSRLEELIQKEKRMIASRRKKEKQDGKAEETVQQHGTQKGPAAGGT